MSSGFIPKEKLSAYERWELADFSPQADKVEEIVGQEEETLKLPTAEDIERIHNEAHAAGYAAGQDLGHAAGYEAGFEGALAEGREAGYSAGYLAGRTDAINEAQRLAALGNNLRQRLQALDQEIAEELLTVAVEIASQVLRQSLRIRPELILPVVRQAMSELPLHGAHPAIYLNPVDAALVRTHLGEHAAQHGWRIIEDDEIAAGGCRIVSGASEVDATLATRWRRVLDAIGTQGEWLEPKP